jgi:hypothetical protein
LGAPAPSGDWQRRCSTTVSQHLLDFISACRSPCSRVNANHSLLQVVKALHGPHKPCRTTQLATQALPDVGHSASRHLKSANFPLDAEGRTYHVGTKVRQSESLLSCANCSLQRCTLQHKVYCLHAHARFSSLPASPQRCFAAAVVEDQKYSVAPCPRTGQADNAVHTCTCITVLLTQRSPRTGRALVCVRSVTVNSRTHTICTEAENRECQGTHCVLHRRVVQG